ncbi:MAG TPA: TRAP transporter substrate-binding protein DctP [Propionibacteriaceae bacterium]|nr:TRAP transporter substrate-binding protein DctP [Propionibacteriaceae bacterium]
MKRVRWAQAAGALAALIACVGCQASPGDKSGGAGATEVLVLANNDGTMDGVPAVQLFADRIGELSRGRISVTIESEWAGGGDETRVITDVADGNADLGWSGTRAFDLKGVKSFQPLHAPFLIQSHDALNAVVQDPVAKDMLAALSPLGLTGLAVTADEFRMPAAAANPVRTPAEFHGLRFGTFGSEIQSEGLAALGAEPVRLSSVRPPEINTVDGVETSLTTYLSNGQYGTMPFITANAALWPRSVALFANSERLATLDEDARGWIQQAADDAAAWSLLHAGDREQDEMNRACTFGAKVVTASEAELVALRKAADPVYARLGADAQQAKALEMVKSLVSGAASPEPLEIPAGCAYRTGDEKRLPLPDEPLSGPGSAGDLPQGVYRFELDRQRLIDAGSTEHDADLNAGVYTYRFESGRWSYKQDPADGHTFATSCEGWYTVRGDGAAFTTVTTVEGGDCAPPTWSARWNFRKNTLTWSDVSIKDFGIGFAGDWQKIG